MCERHTMRLHAADHGLPGSSEVQYWYTDIEDVPIVEPFRQWCRHNPWFPVTAVVLYLTVIFFYSGPRDRKEGKVNDSRPVLLAWNLLLAFFSVMGALRIGSFVLYDYLNGDRVHNMCTLKQDNASAVWTVMFVLSKFVELGDTMFLIANGKPVIFLHWYHHVTVLLFTWMSFVTAAPISKYFGFMNVVVHTFMYSYYAAQAAGIRVPKWIAVTITSLQILQMIGGLSVLWLAYSVSGTSDACYGPHNVLLFGSLIYASYFILFVQFFVNSYIACRSDKSRFVEEQKCD